MGDDGRLRGAGAAIHRATVLPRIHSSDRGHPLGRAHADPGDGIVCNSPYVGFYGKLPVAVLDHRAGTVREAVAYAPVRAQYDFVVLHVNAHGYLPQWIDEVAANYQQVCQFDDPGTGGKPKKVLVFQAKHDQLRQASRGDRS